MITLNEIEVFMRAKQMPPTRFGREAANDPMLIFDLRRGREMGRRMHERILAYLKGAVQ